MAESEKELEERLKRVMGVMRAIGHEPGRHLRKRSTAEADYVAAVRVGLKELCETSGMGWDKIAQELSELGIPTRDGQALRKRLNEGTIKHAHVLMLASVLGLKSLPVPSPAEARKIHADNPKQLHKRNRLALDR